MSLWTKNERGCKKIYVADDTFFVKQNIKMLIIACNTATAAALEDIRAELPIPVLGVILPGARAALKASSFTYWCHWYNWNCE